MGARPVFSKRNLVLSVLLLGWGCASEESTLPPFEVSDSSGVEIVVSHFASGFQTQWTLSAEPIFRVGKGRDEEPYLFQNIEGTTRLSDGSVVVMDWPTGEIRRFDAQGQFLLSFAGRGEGPGEFESPKGGIQRLGDTLIVLDSDGTVARFHPDGDLLSEIPTPGLAIREEGIIGAWTSVSADGVLWGMRRQRDWEQPAEGVFRPPYSIVSADIERTGLRTMGEYRFVSSYAELGGTVSIFYPLFRTAERPSRNPVGLIVGDSETFEIDLFSSDGTLLRRMRYPEGILDADPDVVAIERQAWFRQYELAVEGGRSLDLPRQRRLIDGIPYPETWPGFMHLIGDEEGYIWTLEYGPKDMISTAMRGIDEPRMALVFHPDGYLLGSVELPARFTPFEIGPDYVLGTEDDDLGVEEVVLYGLDKGRLKE